MSAIDSLPRATRRQIVLIASRCTRAHLDRDAALAFCSRVAGRPILTRTDLTVDEASWVLDALDLWHRDGTDPTVPERSNT